MKYASSLALALLVASTVAFSQAASRPNPVVQFFLSPEIKSPPGFSQAAVVAGGKLVFISGQVGRNKEGKLVGDDFRAQTTQTFANLKAALAAAGAKPEHLVKLNYFVVGLNQERLAAVREVRNQFIGKAEAPTSTLAGVQALAAEGALVEIEAVAVIP